VLRATTASSKSLRLCFRPVAEASAGCNWPLLAAGLERTQKPRGSSRRPLARCRDRSRAAASGALIGSIETAASSPIRKSCWCCRIGDKPGATASTGGRWRALGFRPYQMRAAPIVIEVFAYARAWTRFSRAGSRLPRRAGKLPEASGCLSAEERRCPGPSGAACAVLPSRSQAA
jgi:hypothetical protein